MIVLPINSDEIDKLQLDEIILSILIRNRSPFNVNELTATVNTLYTNKKKHLPRAVRRCLNDLCEKKIVECKKTGISTYTINMDSLKEGVDLAERFLQENSIFRPIRDAKDEQAFTKLYSFTNLKELDNFIEEFELFWIENIRTDEDVILYELLYNRQCLSDPVKETDVFKRLGIVHYVVCKDRRFITRKKEGKWTCRNTFVRVDGLIDHSWDTVVLGDYLITISYPHKVLEEIEEAFSDPTSGSTVKRILNIQGNITVTIQKNKQLSKVVFDNIAQKFPGKLQGVIDELREQKENSKPLQISLKWNYMVPEQVNVLTSNKGKEEVHGENLPWMLSDRALTFIQESLKNIQNFFPKKDSLSVIELGPGPIIKPINILSKLTETYSELEFIGVDYSEEVIARADKNIKEYLIGVNYFFFKRIKSKKFVKTDFLDLIPTPDKLLNEITYKQRLFLFIGSNHNSFDPDEVQKYISAIIKPGDCFVIDAESLESEEEFKEISERYKSDYKTEFNMKSFYELGFTKDCFDTHYRFNKEEWCVEGIATVKKVPKTLLPSVQKMNLKKGDKIRFFRNRKPSRKMLEEELKRLGNIEATFKKNKQTRRLVVFGRVLP